MHPIILSHQIGKMCNVVDVIEAAVEQDYYKIRKRMY